MTNLRCARTGIPVDPGDAVWDGEWLSWEWINSQLDSGEEGGDREEAEYQVARPPMLALAHAYDALLQACITYYELTDRYLEVWGELGEVFAEMQLGLVRNERYHAGSDGTIAGKRVEVKTISPDKRSDKVQIKRCGDFEQLLIVSFNEDFDVRYRLFERSDLAEGTGKFVRARLGKEE